MTGKAQQAWQLYEALETSEESYSVLQLIANDCYTMGAFYYAAKVRHGAVSALKPAIEPSSTAAEACYKASEGHVT